MQKINDLFSKRVIDQNTGNVVATVRNVILSSDVRQIMGLIVGNDRTTNQVIRWNTITGVGEFVVIDGSRPPVGIEEDSEMASLHKEGEKLTGKPVMSTAGERLGTVSNIFYNNRGDLVGYEVKHSTGVFGSDTLVLMSQEVQAVGKDAIIANTTDLRSSKDVNLEDLSSVSVGEPLTTNSSVSQSTGQLGNPYSSTNDVPADTTIPPANDRTTI